MSSAAIRSRKNRCGDKSPAATTTNANPDGIGSDECRVDDLLCYLNNVLQVFLTVETFCVDFIDFLGTGWPCRKPAVGGDHLDTTDRGVVAGRAIEHLFDLFTGQPIAGQLIR